MYYLLTYFVHIIFGFKLNCFQVVFRWLGGLNSVYGWQRRAAEWQCCCQQCIGMCCCMC